MYEVRQDILEVAKALGEETRFGIFRRIADAERPLTVKDLVAQLGMHHSAIRIHLNRLEDAGLIVSQKQHRKGVVGRPQLAFLPSPKALSITLPPRDYEFLARLTVDMVRADGDGGSRDEFCGEWGRGYLRERGRPADGPLPLDKAVAVLLRELRTMGASPTSASVDDGFELSQANCVFNELATRADGTVCRLHQAVLRGMLSQLCDEPFSWEHVAQIASGDAACVMRIRRA